MKIRTVVSSSLQLFHSALIVSKFHEGNCSGIFFLLELHISTLHYHSAHLVNGTSHLGIGYRDKFRIMHLSYFRYFNQISKKTQENMSNCFEIVFTVALCDSKSIRK